MSGTHAHGLQMCGCPARGKRRAGREVASVLRWCGGGCRWAIGALPSDEEDRHGRHGRHHQQFRSVRAFHRLRLFGFSRRWFPAPGLGHWAPDRLSVLISNSRARAPGRHPSTRSPTSLSHSHLSDGAGVAGPGPDRAPATSAGLSVPTCRDPASPTDRPVRRRHRRPQRSGNQRLAELDPGDGGRTDLNRSEEHTSELQSR